MKRLLLVLLLIICTSFVNVYADEPSREDLKDYLFSLSGDIGNIQIDLTILRTCNSLFDASIDRLKSSVYKELDSLQTNSSISTSIQAICLMEDLSSYMSSISNEQYIKCIETIDNDCKETRERIEYLKEDYHSVFESYMTDNRLDELEYSMLVIRMNTIINTLANYTNKTVEDYISH